MTTSGTITVHGRHGGTEFKVPIPSAKQRHWSNADNCVVCGGWIVRESIEEIDALIKEAEEKTIKEEPTITVRRQGGCGETCTVPVSDARKREVSLIHKVGSFIGSGRRRIKDTEGKNYYSIHTYETPAEIDRLIEEAESPKNSVITAVNAFKSAVDEWAKTLVAAEEGRQAANKAADTVDEAYKNLMEFTK